MDRIRTVKIVGAAFLAVFCIFLISFLLGAWHPTATKYPDSDWYIKIANGDIKDVVQPFGSRVLHPMIVRTVSSLSGFNIDLSFYIVNVFLLLGFVFVLSLFFSEISFMNPFLAFVVFFAPFLLDFHRNFYMSDVLFGFLAVLFLFFLKKKNLILSLSLLFLLFFSRPSDAMVFGVIFLMVSFFKKETKWVRAGSIVVLIGYLLSSQIIARLGAPNIHNISDLVYRFLEPPYYFIRSILGIDWMVSPQVQYCQVKSFIFIPNWMHLGNIKWIGVCGFNILNPLSVVFYALITFGLIPGMLFFILRKNWRENWRPFFVKSDVWLLVALFYGILLFILGFLVPNLRTVSYGWPAFWLASLFIFDKQIQKWPVKVGKDLVKLFTVIQATLLWAPYLIIKNLSDVVGMSKYFLAFFVAAFLYLVFIKIYSVVAKKYNVVYDLQI